MDNLNLKVALVLTIFDVFTLSTCLPLENGFNIFNGPNQNAPAGNSFFGFNVKSPVAILRPILKPQETLQHIVNGFIQDNSNNKNINEHQILTPPENTNKFKVDSTKDNVEKNASLQHTTKNDEKKHDYEGKIEVITEATANNAAMSINVNKNETQKVTNTTDNTTISTSAAETIYDKIDQNLINLIFNNPSDSYMSTTEAATVYEVTETNTFENSTTDQLNRFAPAPVVATLLG